jgi:hypothetical protein
VERRIKKI